MDAIRILVLAGVMVGVCITAVADVQVRRYNEGPAPIPDGQVAVRDIRPDPVLPPEGEQGFGFAIIPQMECPSPAWNVCVCRFNLFVGKHRNVYGFDFGLLGNLTENEMGGLSVAGLFAMCGTSEGALQVSGLFNKSNWAFSGLQLAAAMNWAEGEMSGVQIGLTNRAGRLNGVQIGAFNMSESGGGAQIGVINCAGRLAGAQIGVLNLNASSSVPCLPILNFAF